MQTQPAPRKLRHNYFIFIFLFFGQVMAFLLAVRFSVLVSVRVVLQNLGVRSQI